MCGAQAHIQHFTFALAVKKWAQSPIYQQKTVFVYNVAHLVYIDQPGIVPIPHQFNSVCIWTNESVTCSYYIREKKSTYIALSSAPYSKFYFVSEYDDEVLIVIKTGYIIVIRHGYGYAVCV